MSDYNYMNNLTDSELLEVVDEHYYSIGVTGAEAVSGLVNDIAEGLWENLHGVPTARMKRVLIDFIALLMERNAWNVVAGVISDGERKKRVTRIGRLIKARKR